MRKIIILSNVLVSAAHKREMRRLRVTLVALFLNYNRAIKECVVDQQTSPFQLEICIIYTAEYKLVDLPRSPPPHLKYASAVVLLFFVTFLYHYKQAIFN